MGDVELMKIGIISDTHGNRGLMGRVLKYMKKEGISKVYHLGDTYQDSRNVLDYDLPVVGVPGIYESEFTDPYFSNEVLDEVDGVRFLLLHDRTKLTSHMLKKAQVVLYGHSHEAVIKRDGTVIYMNPGHLKSSKDKGYWPSFGLIEVKQGSMVMQIRDLMNGVIDEEVFVIYN